MNRSLAFRVHFKKESDRNLRVAVAIDDMFEFRDRIVKGDRAAKGWRGIVGDVKIEKIPTKKTVKIKEKDENGNVTVREVEKDSFRNIYTSYVDFTCFPKRFKTPEAARKEFALIEKVLSKGAKYGGNWQVASVEELPGSFIFEIDEQELPVYDYTRKEKDEEKDDEAEDKEVAEDESKTEAVLVE